MWDLRGFGPPWGALEGSCVKNETKILCFGPKYTCIPNFNKIGVFFLNWNMRDLGGFGPPWGALVRS